MKTSPSITNIMPALLKAQKAMGAAKKGADNPFFHSKYADLGEVMKVCKDPLNENGITYLQPVMGEYVETVLIHETGEWISDDGVKILVKDANNPQTQGSAITYAKRYGLQSILGIPSEDDDGNKATEVPKFKKQINTPEEAKQEVDEHLCEIHNVWMPKRISPKSGNPYWAHKGPNGKNCFGRDSL